MNDFFIRRRYRCCCCRRRCCCCCWQCGLHHGNWSFRNLKLLLRVFQKVWNICRHIDPDISQWQRVINLRILKICQVIVFDDDGKVVVLRRREVGERSSAFRPDVKHFYSNCSEKLDRFVIEKCRIFVYKMFKLLEVSMQKNET